MHMHMHIHHAVPDHRSICRCPAFWRGSRSRWKRCRSLVSKGPIIRHERKERKSRRRGQVLIGSMFHAKSFREKEEKEKKDKNKNRLHCIGKVCYLGIKRVTLAYE